MYEQLLTEGLLTYGYVTNAENVNLEIALPKGLTGIVNATNISPAYTSYLKSLVENDNKKHFAQLADHTLSDLFPKGSLIVGKVISTKKDTFNLSLSPEDINSYLEQVQIKNNMILVGSVKSVEDHGYIIDIGLKDVNAFLSKENASKYNDGKQIKMGQQLHCLVVDVTHIKRNVIRSVILSADPFKIATQMIKDPLPVPLSCICPGLQAEATIVKDEGSYLKAKFLTYDAVIPKCYCNPDEQGHKANSQVRATVLQYHPETKVITLTLRMVYSSEVSEIFPDIFIGKIIKGVVKYISSEKEIYLHLSNGLWAIAHPPDPTAQKRSALLKAYPVLSKHRCCVMKLLPLENLVEVCLSWKPNKPNSESSALKDTLPADESKTKVPEIQKEVKSKKNADIAKPEVEETKPPKTRKEAKSRTVEIVKQEVGETKIPEIEEEETSTKNGNVVSHEVEEAEESRSEITELANLSKIGKVSRATIHKKLEDSFTVLLASSGKVGVLPKMHLSDFQSHCDMLWDIYSEGDMMRVVNFKHLNKTTICSSKLSLRLTAKKGNFVQTFKDIYVGQNLIGIVKTVVDYGIFVEFPGGLLSFAVTKEIAAGPDMNLHKYFKEGMTVSTHVCEINQKKRQFRVSLKLKKTDIDSDFQLTYFRNYFKEKNIIIDHLKSTKDFPWLFEDLHTGDLCNVTVTKVVKEGVHCTLESGTKGFIATHHRKGLTVKKSMTVPAVILDLDLLQGIIQLIASPVVVKQVMKMQKKPEKIPKNKRLKSHVLLVRKEFVIVLLKMKGKAKLAYLSPKMHMNDVFNWDYYKVGDTLFVQYVRRINCKNIVKLYEPVTQIARLTKRLQETTSEPKTARISDKGSQLFEAMDVDTTDPTLPESSKSRKKKKTAMKRKSNGYIGSDDDDAAGTGKKCKLDLKSQLKLCLLSSSTGIMKPLPQQPRTVMSAAVMTTLK
ncbi:protein RRP5 homolog isoform X1 [Octopus sinensis]|uniref:Protein RRP5 homolog isoform X1 n=1 Tax=Octopus sinensis TaxID=2607531 RepID=A0A6P7TIU4_9MOLL|nr:protein RRP5 homolog isoform X1 [Octopus sinensis]